MKGINYAIVITIVILIGIASVLGYLISRQPSLEKRETSEKQILLNFPGEDSSLEERQRHFELVNRSAEEAEYLDITGCNPNPVVLRVKMGETFTLRNQDKVEHSLVIGKPGNEKTFTGPADSTKLFKVDFEEGLGIYGYRCDDGLDAAGILLVS